MQLVGFLSSRSRQDSTGVLAAWLQGLNQTGHVDGQNIAVQYRWAEGRYDLVPALVNELVNLDTAVIVTAGGSVTALPARAATSKIPIVFIVGSDPVKDGIVDSLARPSGNITGVTLFTSDLGPKRLGLIRELTQASPIAVLLNPNDPAAPNQITLMQGAAGASGQKIVVLSAASDKDIDGAFNAMVDRQYGALVVMPNSFFNTRRQQIVTLASKHNIPAIYESREFASAGGLMSYGTSYSDTYRQAGVYTGRILSGTKPADLPVLEPSKFEFVINLRTAKGLGLSVPYSMQLLADEVIE
jgi:putative ABC transport system substrate-binding protein